MWNFGKIRHLFTFDKIVGYATIIGSVAAVAGATIVKDFTVKLQPVINIIQEEQRNIGKRIVRDTITLVHKDTVILKETHRDTIIKYIHDNRELSSEDKEKEQLNHNERIFRERHNLP